MTERTCNDCVWRGHTDVCSVCNGPNDTLVSQYRCAKGDPSDTRFIVKPAKTAPELLTDAANIMEERGKQYDQEGGERSMGKTVAAFNIITGRDLKESEGWLLLQILKDVRDRTTEAPHEDSLVDGVSYSALKAEARLAGK